MRLWALRVRLPQALERLVQFYEATGDTSAAATWREQLEATRAKDAKEAKSATDGKR